MHKGGPDDHQETSLFLRKQIMLQDAEPAERTRPSCLMSITISLSRHLQETLHSCQLDRLVQSQESTRIPRSRLEGTLLRIINARDPESQGDAEARRRCFDTPGVGVESDCKETFLSLPGLGGSLRRWNKHCMIQNFHGEDRHNPIE